METAVSDLERDSRPWALVGLGVLVLFVLAVLAVRLLGSTSDGGSAVPDDAAATPAPEGADGAVGGAPGEVEGTVVAPERSGPDGSASAGPGVPEAVGVRVYAVDGDQLVSLDVRSGLVQRSPIDFTGRPDGARHVFASQGRVLVWPVGDRSGLAAVDVRDGRTGRAEVLVESVAEAQPGWSLGNVAVHTGGGLGEIAGDGSFRWGPVPPPPTVGGRLVGALNQRAVLSDGTVGSWGPIDIDGPGPELVPAGGELVALGADGPIWIAADGRLHLPGLDADVVLEPPASSDGRWHVAGASVAPNGSIALALAGPGGPPSLLVLDRNGRSDRPDGADGAAGYEGYGLPGELGVVRWSPDSRWVLAADPDMQTVVVVRPSSAELFELPALPVDEPADYAVVRVSARPSGG